VTIPVPVLDDRSFDELVAEAKARIGVHTPEWTNLNDSDPGITIIEVFAFLTENLLYRSNRIPEANRIKFLTMLGIPVQPASPGNGLVAFSNDRGPLAPLAVPASTQVMAGQVPFLTGIGLAALPVTCAAYYKAPQVLDAATQATYQQLYQTFLNAPSDVLSFYLPIAFGVPATGKPDPVVDLGDSVNGPIDHSLWLAVLAPPNSDVDAVRAAIGGQTLSIGVYPATQASGQVLPPMTMGGPDTDPGLVFEIAAPAPDQTDQSPKGFGVGPASYARLPITYADPVLQAPGVVQLTLPPYQKLLLWNFDPEEEGTGDFPPRLDDTSVEARLVTWIRLRYPPLHTATSAATKSAPTASGAPNVNQGQGGNGTGGNGSGNGGTGGCGCSGGSGGCGCLAGVPATMPPVAVLTAEASASNAPSGRLTWVGLNAATVIQAVPVVQEIVGTGTGTPFQTFSVANTPVIADATRFLLEVAIKGSDDWVPWQQIDDIYAAAPDSTTYMLDPASGVVTGGSGLFGARFPLDSRVRASYRYGGGSPGKQGIGAISKSAALPGGFSVSNPVATWGASDPETASDAEANITRWLRHRDRLVTADDFADVTRRTPGIDLGRVEVLPLFNPDGADPTATWPGMVTVLVIPRSDPLHPNAPVPDLLFLDAVCKWLDPRRLITTEVHVRKPLYQQIWVSVGIEVLPGQVPSLVSLAVQGAVQTFLSPLTGGLPVPTGTGVPATGSAPSGSAASGTGWPLGTPVRSQDIEAVATRVPGVRYVNPVLIAGLAADGSVIASLDPVPITGLQLPAATVFVNTGSADDPSSLIGSSQPALPTQVPVPVVPKVC
jgi:hypothetical protein